MKKHQRYFLLLLLVISSGIFFAQTKTIQLHLDGKKSQLWVFEVFEAPDAL